ncbi:hypothetical protein O7599_26780 [Streptomyces sp. WMMC500]|uniref:hypothetical protein n=1 Tax=Streptomyces sp. WMMC500 TaxID=3015154 RepID=UPI00248B2A04|nr:hypothetical protein [Streptomyces sp. WMMC500]WBB59166.1 hypothetical protein O7599_26780 [Streptomyces sp. WMMC500]
MNEPETSTTDTAYANAPSIAWEISWVLRALHKYPLSHGVDREFWLRKAALLDRIALREETTLTPEAAAEAVTAAGRAARQLADYDATFHGLSYRGEELATDEDFRAYVRRQYQAARADRG